MHKRDKFVLLTTFMFGFFCGVYLYLVGFSPNYSIDLEALRKSDMVIAGERYGGCQVIGSCPAFQISDKGEYRFVPETASAVKSPVVEGRLPASLYDALQNAVFQAPLGDFSELIEPASCASFVDGIDTVYSVMIDKDEFSLDTCGTRFDTDSDFGEALEAVWRYLETESQPE